MFANDPSLYGLTYRDLPMRPPFLGANPWETTSRFIPQFGMTPWETIPRFMPPQFGMNPWETIPRFMPPQFGMNPWETIPRFMPPQFGMGQPMYNLPAPPFPPYMHAAPNPFVQPNVNVPFCSFFRPFGV